jgi:hypothetical protein
MGRTPFLTGLHHRLQARCPSLAYLMHEAAFLPISWRKELINICQTGVGYSALPLCPVVVIVASKGALI